MSKLKGDPELVSQVSGMGCLWETILAIVSAVLERGGTEEHLRKVRSDGALAGKIADLIVGTKEPVFSRDMRKEGWTPLEPGPRRTINSVSDLELVEFLKSGEDSINGEEMVRLSRQELNTNLGQEDAEWLLEHQNEIPREWRNYYLTFTGTVWRDESGFRRVVYLRWLGEHEQWCLRFAWLERDCTYDARILRPRK